MPSLQDCVGKTMSMSIPVITGKSILELKIEAVETAGIWISGQIINDKILSKLKLTVAPQTPIMFVPFSQVFFMLDFGSGVALSDQLMTE
jgi:hypothetical protein